MFINFYVKDSETASRREKIVLRPPSFGKSPSVRFRESNSSSGSNCLGEKRAVCVNTLSKSRPSATCIMNIAKCWSYYRPYIFKLQFLRLIQKSSNLANRIAYGYIETSADHVAKMMLVQCMIMTLVYNTKSPVICIIYTPQSLFIPI